jgi:hypothetical protein
MLWRRKTENLNVKISICKEVLEAVYDECDKYNIDETGGRIIGFWHHKGNKLDIEACGFIGPGPNARRTATSFFQDGEHQETVFRKVEVQYPKVEHLGNWHTHHVNGLQALSSGDIRTYQRTVNHEKHNTDFFYALLVIAKNHPRHSKERYQIKHFLFKRGTDLVYEIPSANVKIVNKKAIFVDTGKISPVISTIESVLAPLSRPLSDIKNIRARDKEFMSETYPKIRPFYSKQTDSLYWKGELDLIDNTSVGVFLLELIEEGKIAYSVTLASPDRGNFKCNKLYTERKFDSASMALCLFERDLNREIFGKYKK